MYKKLLSITGAFLLVTTVVSGAANAAAPPSSTANFSKSYVANREIKDGAIVSLKAGETNTVEPANSTNLSRIIGVAVADDESLLAVNSGGGKVQVATSGVAEVYVSTLNGPIKVGDQISASPINGVGMKLSGGRILGVAQGALSSNTANTQTEKVSDKSGKVTDVRIGKIKLNIAVGASTNTGQAINQLQQLVKSITGRTIPTVRIVISITVALVAIIVMISLIYSSIYGALISIGRNPLARRAIFRALLFVVLMVVSVAIVAIVLVSLLLR